MSKKETAYDKLTPQRKLVVKEILREIESAQMNKTATSIMKGERLKNE